MDERRPWYVDMVKEIGGLGLALVMLVGLYFLAEDFAGNMKDTLLDIKEISKTELEEDRMHRESIQGTITKFMTEQSSRMTEQAKRMRDIEERISRLEK